jgi:beta-lactamase regulating signal transducer with metallopeptidase domain
VQVFLQSDFLKVLANGLIASIWQMGLLWFITTVLLKLFKFSSAQKFNIAFTAQLSGFILFIYTCINAYTTGTTKIIIDTIKASFIADANTFIAGLMPFGAVCYLGMLIFKLTKLAFIFNDTQHLKKHNLKKMPAAQRIFVQQVSEMFSLHRKVRIYLSEKITCPLTTGFLKPVILIPIAAINYLTTEQMEAVLLHELAHIKRADFVLYLLQGFIEKIFFFNIFSTMLGEIIERERENACDDWVLQFRYNSMHYAEALFKLGRLKALPVMAMPLQGKKESLLLMRIKRLLHNPQKTSYHFQSILLGIASIMITVGLLISPADHPAKEFVGVNVNIMNIRHSNPVKYEQVVAEVKRTKPIKQLKKQRTKPEPVNALPVIKAQPAIAEVVLNERVNSLNQVKQSYIYKVRQSLDSLKQAIPQFNQAVAEKVELNAEMLQKAISYQNFKQLEAMLAATGDSVKVTEDQASEDSYRKQITIESFDKQGNKHVYSVIVELYQ